MIWHFGCHYLNSCFSIEAMSAHNWNYHYPSTIFEVKCMDVMIKHQKNARPIMISASKVMIWYPRNITFWLQKGWIVSSTKIFKIKKHFWKIKTWKDFGSTVATERDRYLLKWVSTKDIAWAWKVRVQGYITWVHMEMILPLLICVFINNALPYNLKSIQ